MATVLPVLDNSAVNTFNECPRKFQYQYIFHYNRAISAALHFGAVWHKMMEVYYQSGGDEVKAMAAGVVAWGDIVFPDDHRTLQRAISSFTKYAKTYGGPPEHNQTIGLREGAPLVEMALELQWPEIPLPYVGKIDMIIRNINGDAYVRDHKTASRMDATFFRGFEMASQMIGYTALATQFLNMPVAGVQVNAYNITPTGKADRFERQFVDLPKERVEYWATVTLPAQMNRIIEAYEKDDFPQNHASCVTKYGLCQFFDVCTLPQHHRERNLRSNFEVRVWNPLAAD